MWIEIADRNEGIFNYRASEADPSRVKWSIGEPLPEIPDGRRLRFGPTTNEEQTLLLEAICQRASPTKKPARARPSRMTMESDR